MVVASDHARIELFGAFDELEQHRLVDAGQTVEQTVWIAELRLHDDAGAVAQQQVELLERGVLVGGEQLGERWPKNGRVVVFAVDTEIGIGTVGEQHLQRYDVSRDLWLRQTNDNKSITLRISTLCGILSAQATCSGDPIMGLHRFTLAPIYIYENATIT